MATRSEALAEPIEMMSQGRLVLDQVAPIAANVPDASIPAAAKLAEYATVTQLRRVLPHYKYPTSEGIPEPPDVKNREPSIQMRSRDGWFNLSFETNAVEGELVA